MFAGGGAIAIGKLPSTGVALAFDLVISVMIYALGHISGAHFNGSRVDAWRQGGRCGGRMPLARQRGGS